MEVDVNSYPYIGNGPRRKKRRKISAFALAARAAAEYTEC